MKKSVIIKIISILMILTLFGGIIFWVIDGNEKDSKAKGKGGTGIDRTSVIFTASQSNWGCMDGSTDYWQGSDWTVHCDGTVEYYKYYNLSGATEVVTWKLSEEDLNRLEKILDGGFKLCMDDMDGCDGTGWEMISYDETYKKIHEFDGYIYGNPVLEEIAEIISPPES